MSETDQERADRAELLAFQRGVRQAEVDARLASHEARLNAINGSIERHARNAGALRDSVEAVDEKVDQVINTLNAQRAVEESRVKQLKDANEQQISNRNFWLGVAVIVVTLLASQLSQDHIFGLLLGSGLL